MLGVRGVAHRFVGFQAGAQGAADGRELAAAAAADLVADEPAGNAADRRAGEVVAPAAPATARPRSAP